MRRIAIAVSIAVLMIAGVGCSKILPSSTEGSDMTSNDSWLQLDHPESAEALLARLRATVEEIGRITIRHSPEMTPFYWSTTHGDRGGLAGCGGSTPDHQPKGAEPETGAYLSDSPIPEHAWPAVLDEVSRLLKREYDATTSSIPQDRTGHHDVRYSSHDGFSFAFGYQLATSIDASGPCRRKADPA